MALILSVGFVVDDAIVVLENIVRHLEMGEKPFQAALKGSREIGFTIVSMTLSLAAVFIPVFFMGGILGRLLHEFAVTIAAAILVSGVVSLTLTPMLCSRFLRPPREEGHGRLYALMERFFHGMLRLYDATLLWVLRRRRETMITSLLLLILTLFLFGVIPKGFLPNEDQGTIFAFTEAAQGISFEAMMRQQKAVMEVVSKNPYLKNFFSAIGASIHSVSGNTGRIFIRLIPRGQRPGVEEVIQQLRPQFATIPGIRVFPQVLPPIRIGGMLTKSQYQMTLQSPDIKDLYHYAPLLEEKMRTIPGLLDVTSDLLIKTPR
jgi:HAE1 family hydrophobic/amphiphilic exporter-1